MIVKFQRSGHSLCLGLPAKTFMYSPLPDLAAMCSSPSPASSSCASSSRPRLSSLLLWRSSTACAESRRLLLLAAPWSSSQDSRLPCPLSSVPCPLSPAPCPLPLLAGDDLKMLSVPPLHLLHCICPLVGIYLSSSSILAGSLCSDNVAFASSSLCFCCSSLDDVRSDVLDPDWSRMFPAQFPPLGGIVSVSPRAPPPLEYHVLFLFSHRVRAYFRCGLVSE